LDQTSRLLLHHLLNRLHGALGGHHRGGADFEHLHDVRRVACTIGGNASVHRIGIRAFVTRNDFVFFLGRVELVSQLDDDVVIRAGHRMPPLNFRLRHSRRCNEKCGERNGRAKCLHQILPIGLRPRATRGDASGAARLFHSSMKDL